MSVVTLDELSIGGEPRDYVVNGRPLRAFAELGGKVFTRDYTKALLMRARPPFDSGRVPLYVCSQCGDLGCGAVTVRVTEVDEYVVWSELSVEAFDGGGPIRFIDERWERDFYFARDAYFATLY